MASSDDQRAQLSRREMLLAGGALAFGAAAGGGISLATTRLADSDDPAPIDPTGDHQAGIARPATPQPYCLLGVLAVADTNRQAIADALESVSSVIRAFAGTDVVTPETPDGAGDISVTVGLGPRLVTAIDATLPAATAMPTFAGDQHIPEHRRDGDALINVCSSNPAVLAPVMATLVAAWPGAAIAWQQLGFRGPGEGTVVRNPLGFHDGVIGPRGEADLDENVWIADGPAAGGTVCVVRQLRLNVPEFIAEDVERQEAIIGRKRSDGAPLSGGGPMDEVDLRAKAPDGELITPLRSHARAAHPSFTGSKLMLRRGYAYVNGPAESDGVRVDDQGLLFVCFQRELDDFVKTQLRMDESDDLMDYATPVSSGSFLILPGMGRNQPLGASLVI